MARRQAAMRERPNLRRHNRRREEYFTLKGGLNLVDPPLKIPPGELISATNYEETSRGGYRRIDGFERFDGRPRPSAAVYYILNFDAGQDAISDGDTITGLTSGATGIVILDAVVTSGTYGGNDAAGYVIYTKQGGTPPFQDDEAIQVSAVTKVTADGVPLVNSATETSDHLDWLFLAAEEYRSDILVVPGSGNMRGVHVFAGDVYAFRDNAGATFVDMYKATSSGWVLQVLGEKISFDAGITEFLEEETLTGAGGTTSTIKRVVLQSGAWGTAAAEVWQRDVDVGWVDETVDFNDAGAGDVDPFSATEAVDDYFAIGHISTFTNVRVTIGTAGVGGVVVWEFYDGTAWVALNGVTDGSAGFTAGTSSYNISFTLPDNWATISLNSGAPLYFIRARISTVYSTNPVLTQGWIGGNAAGYMSIYTVASGPYVNNEVITSASGSALADGVNAANTLAVGGRYEFKNHNFFGHTKTQRMYGVNGVGPAFEWDGSVYTPILTGMITDTPNHIEIHRNHLFLGFSGGSLQNSASGLPFDWTVVSGAAEFGVGDEITGISEIVDDAMAILTRNTTKILYGTNNEDWDLRTNADETGAIEWTVARLGRVRYLDDRGITELNAVEAYGNIKDATISHKVQPVIDAKKSLISASTIVRAKNQYRLFFTDNTGMILTFRDRKLAGITEFDYGIPVRVIASEEDSAGDEVIYFGSDDGYIYQAEKGTSFDGSAIVAWCILPYYHYGTPDIEKLFRKITPEIDADSSATILIQPDFSYGDPDVPTAAAINIFGGGGTWNVDNWNEFLWSSQTVSTAFLHISNHGNNMGIYFYSSTDREQPHTFYGVTTQYSMRKVQR